MSRLWLIGAFALAGCQIVTGLTNLEVNDAGRTGTVSSSQRGADAGVEGGVEDAAAECPVPAGVRCDLVTQCGCKANEHCQALGTPPRPSCVRPGARARGAACTNSAQCPSGQTCDERTCRSYCRVDADCQGGSCVAVRNGSTASTGLNVCWDKCDPSERDACAEGTRCRSLEPDRGVRANFCAAPADPCPYTENGICDEDKGTGECVEGSDRRDCTCAPTLPDAPCELISQCGCAKGSACFPVTNGSGYSATCVEWTGKRRQNETCSAVEECAPGHLCGLGGLCARICEADEQCGQGRCLPLDLRSSDENQLKVCYSTCERDSGSCGGGARCAEFDGRFKAQGNFCVAPRADCYRGDGVCDEPKGSGLCGEGSDVVDCCEPTLPGGECNLVTQCGCEDKPGTSCIEADRDGTPTTECAEAGQKAPNTWCTDDRDCVRGSGCHGSVCRPYCSEDADCEGGGRCIGTVRNGFTRTIKACVGPCDPASNAPCGPHTKCSLSMLAEGVSAVGCTFMPLSSECPTGNGVCDEPEGTGLCLEGSDEAECP